MSNNNQDTLIKEANELLETAQKEVLKEINKNSSFLSRLFAGKKNAEALKQAQSSISKAINQMKSFSKDESTVVTKLQARLNEKNLEMKKLEEDYKKAESEKEELADKLRNIQSTIEKIQNEAQEIEAASKPSVIEHDDHKIENDFKNKIMSLEETNREIESKFVLTREDLSKSQALVVEFSKRMKRLKSELTSK